MASGMHLMAFMMHTPINHLTLSWADDDDQRLVQLGSFEHWQDLAQHLERGCLDGVFFADLPAPYDHYRDRTDEAVRYGVCWPSHDPVALLGPMAAATANLGFAVTVSIAATPPYLAVRSISTLDYLSRGRMGWNIVTGNARSEHRALGLEMLDHDQRYDRADEYLDVCYALWDGLQPDAIVADKSAGIYADPGKVRHVSHHGRYFRCDATPAVLPSPQGRPVLFQAGSSGRGQQFAMRHADVVFAIQPDLQGMIRLMAQMKAAAGAAGRGREPRVLFAVQPFIASTEAEARQMRDRLVARIPVDAALNRLSGTLGLDFSTFDLDRPLEEMPTQASRGMMKAVTAVGGERRWTVREAIRLTGSLGSTPQIIGTPDQVADSLESLWRQTECHGFNVTPPINPGGLIEFVEHVVPLLQKRGIFRTRYEASTLRGNLGV